MLRMCYDILNGLYLLLLLWITCSFKIIQFDGSCWYHNLLLLKDLWLLLWSKLNFLIIKIEISFIFIIINCYSILLRHIYETIRIEIWLCYVYLIKCCWEHIIHWNFKLIITIITLFTKLLFLLVFNFLYLHICSFQSFIKFLIHLK